MTDTEKRKLLITENSKKPRCFKSAKQLPVTYAENTVSRAELSQWNQALEKKNRKILVLVDNCAQRTTQTIH
ncbi:Tigger transposable element-derived protein 4 [Trichinella pseudospiralis]|uniref:Tigger transposable element-derived protein 4 n=2 Tax=Trichinella pseudospiralis TaxID=6337 RepID=A0A0V1F6Y9_TRIPS|nr:Tigger transposable element-derived protein 4 [Trichinella pseudospiralis]KRY66259.1 Tigger transposable element-derived protein 4 [Trichinella pseudospiralis]KRY81831.1 Tigger transposable element-derived protein 4 [Trichinella pseudospiralis]KRZ19675.1 Tigger transposable element-derived protein 4 [Trichinella pseudospiralis]KRZ26351.1 Tigger transposable element-derived protein 4 [Trichinella pseudospiralis]